MLQGHGLLWRVMESPGKVTEEPHASLRSKKTTSWAIFGIRGGGGAENRCREAEKVIPTPQVRDGRAQDRAAVRGPAPGIAGDTVRERPASWAAGCEGQRGAGSYSAAGRRRATGREGIRRQLRGKRQECG